jgi:FkbM family methyltransferase
MDDNRTLEISLDFVGRTYRLFGASVDWKEKIGRIFNGERYPLIPAVSNVQTIFDVGAHIGIASIFFKAAYPLARIYSFEPDPEAFHFLRKNVSHFEGVRAFDFGLRDHNTTGRLPVERTERAAAAAADLAPREGMFESASIRDVQDVIAANEIAKIDLLKLDAGGCEVALLRRIGPILKHIQVLYISCHTENCRREIDGLLKDTHILYSGMIAYPHCSQLCFVSAAILPLKPAFATEIGVDGSRSL